MYTLIGDSMKKKNGFTLVEILAVIVILSILMSVAGVSVFQVLEDQKQKLLEDQIKSLADTAITYVESKNWYLKTCPNNFQVNNPDHSLLNKCYREVSVRDIVKANFFENKNDLCNLDDTILVYKKNEGNFANLTAYVKDGTCSY